MLVHGLDELEVPLVVRHRNRSGWSVSAAGEGEEREREREREGGGVGVEWCDIVTGADDQRTCNHARHGHMLKWE